MTFDINTAANLASFFCLPATLAAIPGAVAMLSRHFRKIIDNYPRRIAAGLVTLIVMAFLVDASAKFGWLSTQVALVPIYNQAFQNETVVVDGKEFINCTFTDVTFRYDGGNYKFSGAKVSPNKIGFYSGDVKINNAFGLVYGLKLFAPAVTMEQRPGWPPP